MEEAGTGIGRRVLELLGRMASDWEGVLLYIGPYGEPFLYVDPEHHLVDRDRGRPS